MKELSIEEKAKAYDEALERAKECHIDGLSLHQPVKDVIEHIFPELSESEDDRIRKWLIGYFQRNKIAENIKTHDILAWLEKQGEQKTTDNEPKFNVGDRVEKAMHEAGYEWSEETHQLKKIEQKPAWSEEDEKMLNNIDITFFEEKSIPNVMYWKFMNWLKSLKDRVQSKSQWKPSDEQMDALETAVSSLQSNTLKSLYQDLKREKNYE